MSAAEPVTALPSGVSYQLDAELTIRVRGELLANAKRIELLRQIQALENLTKAAKLAGYSYKGAWDAIDQMATLSGGELIERFAGGKGGGRTKLTARGRQLLQNFSLVQDEHRRFIQRLDKLANGLAGDYASRADTAMKTSVRNQFGGVIVSITPGPVNDEIGVMVNGMQIIIASITHESGRELGLQIGAKVFVLVKASSVMLSAETDHASPPASASASAAPSRNRFRCRIQGVIHGERRSEVVAGVITDAADSANSADMTEPALALVSTIANADADRLSLAPGDTVVASFDPSGVMIGVAA